MIRHATIVPILLLLFAASGEAQITITKTDVNNGFMNSRRTTYDHSYTVGAYPTINLYNASASAQTFNFSAMPTGDTRDTLIQDYVSPGGLPGAADFPTATAGTMTQYSPFAGATITFVEFMSVENDGVYALGSYMHQLFPPFIDSVIVSKYVPKRMYYPLPITYGTTRTFRDTVINDASTGEYEVTTRSFLVDGWGAITFPPAGGMPVLSKAADGEQCLRVLTDDHIDVYDGSNTLIGSAHNREIDFVTLATTVLAVYVDDTTFTSGSVAVSSRDLNIKTGATGVEPVPANLPAAFRLSQNYPNPFNPSTTITFVLPSQSVVSLKVYDVLGREVAALADGEMDAGSHTVNFDAARLSGGLYFCRLSAGENTATMKMSFVK